MTKKQAQDLGSLHNQITAEYSGLSRRLQEVANYLMENSSSVALDTLATIAENAGVHASTLIRFANHFGFAGFSDVQKLHKDQLISNSDDYGERIRTLQTSLGDRDDVTSVDLLHEFTEANILSLKHMTQQVQEDDLEQALQMMNKANMIHVCGIRRAFPVSMYFTYALSHMGVSNRAIDGLGSMHLEQAGCVTPADILIAITFRPYSKITQEIMSKAKERGAKIILITDSKLSPAAALADLNFFVKDAEVRSFRSLNSSLCLAQTLCIALGYKRERDDAAQSTN